MYQKGKYNAVWTLVAPFVNLEVFFFSTENHGHSFEFHVRAMPRKRSGPGLKSSERGTTVFLTSGKLIAFGVISAESGQKRLLYNSLRWPPGYVHFVFTHYTAMLLPKIGLIAFE